MFIFCHQDDCLGIKWSCELAMFTRKQPRGDHGTCVFPVRSSGLTSKSYGFEIMKSLEGQNTVTLLSCKRSLPFNVSRIRRLKSNIYRHF